jgi:hypothetical protein
MHGMIRNRKYPQDLTLGNLNVKCIYLVTIALCGGRPRTAVKIKTHGQEAGLCDKGGLIFSFVVAFSVYLLCGRQKRKKEKSAGKDNLFAEYFIPLETFRWL